MKMHRGLFWSMILIVLILTTGCSAGIIPRTAQITTATEKLSIDLGSETSAHVQIVMDTGELSIGSGSSKLMEGTFDYTVEKNRPEVNSVSDGSRVDLLVHQPNENRGLIKQEGVNRWNLLFNNGIPISLEIATGAGNSDLNLSAMDLTSLKIETGAGNGKFDLSGARDHDLSVTIKGGLGDITVLLPREMGVRVELQSGIGNENLPGFHKDGNVYINDAYGTSPNTIHLKIESGVGDVALHLQ